MINIQVGRANLANVIQDKMSQLIFYVVVYRRFKIRLRENLKTYKTGVEYLDTFQGTLENNLRIVKLGSLNGNITGVKSLSDI